MNKILERIIIGGAMTSFFMPLIVRPTQFIFPFIVPKIILFRSLVIIMLGAYLILLYIQWRKYTPTYSLLHLAVLLFLASFAISTFTGVDWYRSFWDNHERMLGLFTFIHYIVYYFILSTVIQDKKRWDWLIRIFLIGGFAVLLIGFWQKVNPLYLLNNGSDRVSATLGNSIYYGGYGLFLAFMGLRQFVIERDRVWKYFSALVAFCGVLGVFFSGTRGSVLGLLVGTGVMIVLTLFLCKENKKLRTGLLSFCIIGIVFLGTAFLFRKTTFVQSIPALGPLVNTTISGGSASTRVMAWGIAVEAWKEAPLFGWGPNNYFYAFNKYYRPEFLRHGWGETWFDNAHNILMNTLAVQGVFGVMTYLGLFGVVAYMIVLAYRRRTLDIPTTIIALGFLFAHLIHNIFVFENPTSYLYFFFFLAFIHAMTRPQSIDASPKGKEFRPISWPLVGIIGMVLLFFLYRTNFQPAKANVLTLTAIKGIYAGQEILPQYQAILALSTPHVDDIRLDMARTVDQVGTQYEAAGEQGKVHLQKLQPLYQVTYEDLKKNIELHPLDLRAYFQLSQMGMNYARLYNTLGLIDEAEKIVESSRQYSPRRQQLVYLLASIKMQLGKFDEAFALLRESIEQDPQIGKGWWRLALFYKEAGEKEKAKAVIEEAKSRGAVYDLEDQRILDGIMADL